MKTLDSKTQMLIAVIAVAAVVFFFGIFPMLQTFLTQGQSASGSPQIPPPPGVFDGAVPPSPPNVDAGGGTPSDTVVSATRTFANSRHTVRGTIMTPTPCHALTHDVMIAESYPEQVTIQFSVNAPAGDMMCAQVIDEKDFTITFSASEQASIRATLNGEPITLSFE